MQKLVHPSWLVRSLTIGSCFSALVACQPVATIPAPTPVYTATIPLEPAPVERRTVNEPDAAAQSKEPAADAPAAEPVAPATEAAPAAVAPAVAASPAPASAATNPAATPSPTPAQAQPSKAPEQAPAKPAKQP